MSQDKQKPFLVQFTSGNKTIVSARSISALCSGGTMTIASGTGSITLGAGVTWSCDADAGNTLENVVITCNSGTVYLSMLGGNIQ